MSLTLILTRHAKSSWSDPLEADFDRPLNARGEASAAAIGRWLAAQGYLPGEVVLSGARRTEETWAGIARALPEAVPMRADRALYHAAAPAVLGVLQRATAPVTMLIGHNPGIGDFASRILRERPDHPRYGDYPTGATAVIRFDAGSWREIGWGQGWLVEFTVPRELIDPDSE